MRTVICAIAVLALAGCSSEQSPTPVTPASGSIESRVTLTSASVPLGSTTRVRLEVVNSGQAVALDFKCRDTYGFRIEAADGSFRMSRPGLCEVSPHSVTVEARDRVVLEWESPVLGPGAYIVRAGILEHEDRFEWGSTRLNVRYPAN